jgi:Cof subfamily protein (haloacid dehalogenase superfamily)
MRYRLLVADVDGTLVRADGGIAPAVAAAVDAARSAGLMVALSTGRTVAACAPLLADLALDGAHIFFDGALVLDPAAGMPVLEERIAPRAAAAVLDFARAHRLTIEFYTRDGYYVEHVTAEVAAHAALQRHPATVADLTAVLASGEVIKAELVLADDEARALVRAFAAGQAGQARYSWATAPGLPHLSFINIVPPHVSKGSGLRALAARAGLDLAAVAAIGDSANDIPMFAEAGLAIAMGNAPTAVRAAAHVVTDPVEADGMATAIERFLLVVA